MSSEGSLREKALRGGVYLTIRKGVGIVLSVLGLMFITRLLGPELYGLYAAAFGFFTYLQTVGEMGTRIYLLRSKQELPLSLFHQAFWWLLFYGVGITLVALALLYIVGSYWVRTEGFVPVAVVMCANLPLTLLSAVPLALLERQLDYKRTTAVELTSQVAYYLVGISLALSGAGVWSVVSAFWVGQVILAVGFFLAARYRPRWYWEKSALSDMLRYSFTQSLSGWIYQMESLAPSMLLLPIAGKEAVGYYSLSMRFLNMLSFASEAIGRLSVPAFAQIQDDPAKLRQAVSESMHLRLLSNGGIYILFALCSLPILNSMLGTKWEVSTFFPMFAILAVYMLFSSVIGVYASALYVLRQNGLMVACSATYVVSVFLLGSFGGWLLPQSLKVYSLALAVVISKVPNFLFVDYGLARMLGRPSYTLTVLWGLGCAIACFAPVFGWWLYLVALPFLVNPISVRTVRSLFQQLRAIRRQSANAPRSTAS